MNNYWLVCLLREQTHYVVKSFRTLALCRVKRLANVWLKAPRSTKRLWKKNPLLDLFRKPGSHEQHKHKDKIDMKTKHDVSSGSCEDKTEKIFLCFIFCFALGLCLHDNLTLMLVTILMSQAWLHFFVLPFVLSLCLCSRVNQALQPFLISFTTTSIINRY